MGNGTPLLHHAGNHVFAKVVAGGGVGQVFVEHPVQIGGVEDVDAHAGQRHIRAARHGFGLRRFFSKADDGARRVNGHDAECAGFLQGHFDAADGAIHAAVHMVLEHQRVIHFVHMVTGQDHHVFRMAALDDVQVLVDGIRRATVPMLFVEPLLRRQQVHHFVELGAQKTPAALQMPQERMRFVLGDDANPPDAGVDAVGQREIDDAEFATEIHRRFGATVGELFQTRATSTGQHQGDGAAHQHMGLRGVLVRGIGDGHRVSPAWFVSRLCGRCAGKPQTPRRQRFCIVQLSIKAVAATRVNMEKPHPGGQFKAQGPGVAIDDEQARRLERPAWRHLAGAWCRG